MTLDPRISVQSETEVVFAPPTVGAPHVEQFWGAPLTLYVPIGDGRRAQYMFPTVHVVAEVIQNTIVATRMGAFGLMRTQVGQAFGDVLGDPQVGANIVGLTSGQIVFPTIASNAIVANQMTPGLQFSVEGYESGVLRMRLLMMATAASPLT